MRIDNEKEIVITLNVDECTKGIFLRWINTLAEYCYYRFDTGMKSNVVKNDSISIQNFLTSVDYSDNYHPGTDYPVTKSGQRSIKLFAFLIDRNEYDFLISLIESVYVDMFTGFDDEDNPLWVRVNVSDGTFTKADVELQDFECTLLFPQTQNQSL